MNAVKIRMYDTLVVRAEEVNTLSQPINVTAADNWATGPLCPGGGCGSADSVGIAVLNGNHTRDDFPWRGGRLALTGGIGSPGPYAVVRLSYVFQPRNASAAEAYLCKPTFPNHVVPPNPCPTVNVKQVQTQVSYSISKYWDLSGFHNLSPGVYTLVAADEWGAFVLMHFEVSSPGCLFPQGGGSTPPFAKTLSTAHGSWAFQLGLNSTFVFRDRGLGISASLTDSNLTDAYFPHILVSRPFLASLQLIGSSGPVLTWTYPPSPRTTLSSFIYSQNDFLEVTNKTMSLLQSNQTYAVVANPMLFIQPDQPYPTGLEIRIDFTVC
jgi:hypothetical protein